jgi:multisubunit Na+/H+ antiporter MnhG subunit
MFLCSACVVVALVLFFFSTAALSLHGNFLLTPMEDRVFVIFLYTIAILFILAIVIIFFGMAIFCMLRERASVSGKILWLVFFFFTGPLGSTLYYFAVYRRLARTQHEVEYA